MPVSDNAETGIFVNTGRWKERHGMEMKKRNFAARVIAGVILTASVCNVQCSAANVSGNFSAEKETGGGKADLESYLQFAQNQREAFAANDTNGVENRIEMENSFNLDCLFFSLPAEWEIDRYASNEYETAYAPGGNSETKAGYFVVMTPEEAFGMVEMILEAKEDFQEAIEEGFLDEADAIEITDMGMTFLGHTAKMEMMLHTEEENGVSVTYIAEDDKNLYMLYAFTPFEEGKEEKMGRLSKEVEKALALFFETGWINERFT